MPLPFQRRGGAQLRPTFSRDFAGLKTLDHGAGPAITFTRASNATYFDASGVLQTASNDQPRFDHDPATGASRGLLIEEARTNLLVRSAELDDAAWTKENGTISANTSSAPDGTTSADKLVSASSGAGSVNHTAFQTATTLNATRYTWSIFAKSDGYSHVQLGAKTGNARFVAVFDLSSGTLTNTSTANSPTGTSTFISSVGSGWYRIAVTMDSVGTDADLNVAISNSATPSRNANQQPIFTGNGTSGILLWGAQLEAGAFPTSYIPTTTAAATRSADSAVVEPISSFYNQAEGTLFAEAVVLPRNANIASISINNAETDRLTLYTAPAGTMRWFINSNNVIEYNSESAAITSGAIGRIAGAYRVNDVIAATNGILSASDTSVPLPPASLTHFFIGRTATTFSPLNGHIRKIAYWPKRLSNTLLQQLTT